MSSGNSVLRFEDVYFGHSEDRLLMENVSFSLRDGAKMTVMGQNGAGKSTMFKLIL
jgi:ATPase subunit of ABC transporter with duplicated ATPase domains